MLNRALMVAVLASLVACAPVETVTTELKLSNNLGRDVVFDLEYVTTSEDSADSRGTQLWQTCFVAQEIADGTWLSCSVESLIDDFLWSRITITENDVPWTNVLDQPTAITERYGIAEITAQDSGELSFSVAYGKKH